MKTNNEKIKKWNTVYTRAYFHHLDINQVLLNFMYLLFMLLVFFVVMLQIIMI